LRVRVDVVGRLPVPGLDGHLLMQRHRLQLQLRIYRAFAGFELGLHVRYLWTIG
jgi:hypothetical protein